MKSLLSVLSICLFLTNITNASTFTSVAGGDFDLPTTWGTLTEIPGPTDDVIIKHDVFVNLTNNKTINSLSLINDGSLLAGFEIRGNGILTVLGNVQATATVLTRDLHLTVINNATLIIQGDCTFTRVAGNLADNFLKIDLNNSSKTYIEGMLIFNYFGSGAGEDTKEITIRDSALLDVTGETRFLSSAGQDFNLGMYGSSSAYLRDSLTLQLTGTGKEAGITLHDKSNLELYSSAYIYNSSSLSDDFAKLRVRNDSSTMYIQDDVYLTSSGARVQLRAEGVDGDMIIGGDIKMNASAQDEVYVSLVSQGEIYLAGNITRATNFGNLTMEQDAALILNGTNPQVIPESNLAGSGTDSLAFRKIVLENTSSQPFVLVEDLVIQDSLILSTGNLVSSDAAKVVLQDSAIISGSSAAYVEGPVQKLGSTAGLDITIPIGTDDAYAPITLSPISNIGSDVTVQYFSEPPPFGIESRAAGIDNVSGTRYWTVEKNASTGDLDVTLTWEDSSEAGVTEVSEMLVVGWDGTEWQSYGNESSGVVGSGGFVTSAFSEPPPFGIESFTIGSETPRNSLPVKLKNFDAIPESGKVYLRWETESEINFEKFELERSTDARHFEKMYSVGSKGEAAQLTQYFAKDLVPSIGINYYRLKMIDLDGTFEYSPMLNVKIEKFGEAHIYPNPVAEELVVHIADWAEEQVTIEIFDLNSKKIFQDVVTLEGREYRVNTSSANVVFSGTYVMKVTGAKTSKVLKFIKVE